MLQWVLTPLRRGLDVLRNSSRNAAVESGPRKSNTAFARYYLVLNDSGCQFVFFTVVNLRAELR
jgi:hypothetical protein